MDGEWIRAPYWPTMPLQSRSPNVPYFVRYYSCGLGTADTDNALGTTATRTIRFDLPVILVAVTGSCILSDGSGIPVGYEPNDTYSILLSTQTNERITVEERLASNVVGTASRPGFFGGGGWHFPAGSALQVSITPRLAGLANGVKQRIDVTVQALEFRSGSSYIPGR